jgi:hypothetical protein
MIGLKSKGYFFNNRIALFVGKKFNLIKKSEMFMFIFELIKKLNL